MRSFRCFRKHVLLCWLPVWYASARRILKKADSIAYSNGHLYVHIYGNGEPVLILTGGPGAGYQQLEDLARHLGATHQAILLEQRGTGRSQPIPYDTSTINLHTAHDDILRVLEHFRLSSVHILGHSWGGMLAASFAALHPAKVRSLVLVDSGPVTSDFSLAQIHAANMESRLSPQERKERGKGFEKANKPGHHCGKSGGAEMGTGSRDLRPQPGGQPSRGSSTKEAFLPERTAC